MADVAAALRERIAATRFIDTHEHLLEERTRLAGAGAHRLQPCDDFALLFKHYAADDLLSAGMPTAEAERFFAPEVEPGEKWRIVAPYWERARHTGYLQAVTLTAAQLFGEERWDAGAAERVTEKMRAAARPGFYREVLAAAGVERCQVNSLEEPLLCETADPALLEQDLSLIALSTGLNASLLSERSGLPARTLDDWRAILDWAFATYGPRAVAVKSQAAYSRRLDYEPVDAAVAGPLFARHAAGEALEGAERKALEDHLMRACVERARQAGLPVKLHCGYYAGSRSMPLARVRQNAGDLCPLLQDFPDARFVLMHIGYPYQDEYIALAKHYPNVWIDLCWAWIINPAATTRFVKEFLLAAPANKLLTFGGDYGVVEPIVGHAAIARRGLERALGELVDEGWLRADDALALVEPLMRGNAEALFGARRIAAPATRSASAPAG
jgi:hypothetical protein